MADVEYKANGVCVHCLKALEPENKTKLEPLNTALVEAATKETESNVAIVPAMVVHQNCEAPNEVEPESKKIGRLKTRLICKGRLGVAKKPGR
jgi:hypothetical protein